MISKGGHLVARGVSYVDAELHLDGIRVLNDVFYLIEDLARGSIPLDTVTEIEGQLHLFSLDVPIQVCISSPIDYSLFLLPLIHTINFAFDLL